VGKRAQSDLKRIKSTCPSSEIYSFALSGIKEKRAVILYTITGTLDSTVFKTYIVLMNLEQLTPYIPFKEKQHDY
jgi:hypothetical protein